LLESEFDPTLHTSICSLLVRLISHQPAVLFSQNKPATTNQPAVLFTHKRSASATSHQPTEQAVGRRRGGGGMGWQRQAALKEAGGGRAAIRGRRGRQEAVYGGLWALDYFLFFWPHCVNLFMGSTLSKDHFFWAIHRDRVGPCTCSCPSLPPRVLPHPPRDPRTFFLLPASTFFLPARAALHAIGPCAALHTPLPSCSLSLFGAPAPSFPTASVFSLVLS
jgi:hypothetical protein